MPPQSFLTSPTLAFYSGAVVVLTLAFSMAYCSIWSKVHNGGVTPTGFGAFIAPVMLGAALISDASAELIASLLLVTAGTAIYWLDDIVHLSARLRVFVSFLAGAGIAFAYAGGQEFEWPVLIAVLFATGCVCVILTNMVNFCDGADLNLATFIALTAVIILYYTSSHRDWTPVALAVLAFILPFGLMNRRPRTIYLGDSGSFAFAGLLTMMAVAFFCDFSSFAPEAAIPAALPTLDVAYVFALRIIEKHDLLTRNYLHLYQRLNRRYSGFAYLLPQFVNAALCLGVAVLLEASGLGRIVSVVVSMIVVTIPFYFACRWMFLAGPPEGPLYELNR